jgi:hypothetical protein
MNSKPDKQTLAEQLRREAAESAPAFSPLLHARIMQRIERSDVAVDTLPINRPRSYRLAFAGLAAAASVTLLLLLHPWSTRPGKIQIVNPGPSPSTQPNATLPQFALGIDNITTPASQQLDDVRFAYLDRDAKHFASFMMRQVDVLPGK